VGLWSALFEVSGEGWMRPASRQAAASSFEAGKLLASLVPARDKRLSVGL